MNDSRLLRNEEHEGDADQTIQGVMRARFRQPKSATTGTVLLSARGGYLELGFVKFQEVVEVPASLI